MKKKVIHIADNLEIKFEPIIKITTGNIYGVDIKLSGFEKLGFDSKFHCFNELKNEGLLSSFLLLLWDNIFKKYNQIKIDNLYLFYKFDTCYIPNYQSYFKKFVKYLDQYSIKNDLIYIYFGNDHSNFYYEDSLVKATKFFKELGFNVRIDGFGNGFSTMKLLYNIDVSCILLDSFYINNLSKTSKKRFFSTYLTRISHQLGIKVIAKSIKNKSEFLTCKDIGIDYVKGIFIQKAQENPNKIKDCYTHIKKICNTDKRIHEENKIKDKYIETIKPMNHNTKFHKVFEYFKNNANITIIPIVDEKDQLVGVIYEEDIKELSYSKYGSELAKNSSMSGKLMKFVKTAISIDKDWGVDKMLDLYSSLADDSTKGIFVTYEDRYFGYISLNNLLVLSHERNIEIAKNQNPLTKLPGNNIIQKYLKYAFNELDHNIYHIVYFDFNDFKPFNDIYGFRLGDRAILLFSELLRKYLTNDEFIAHVGGDDFFVGFKNIKYEDVYKKIDNIQKIFKNEVSSLYNIDDINRGFIVAKDRFGIQREFALLSVAAAIIELTKINLKYNNIENKFDTILGTIKKISKSIDTPIGVSIVYKN
ncbi:MAG: EAL domain-containing protein [Campylobacterota bacterium]|nr:EAL domain-containing protein [Campylobacterota bacterium]